MYRSNIIQSYNIHYTYQYTWCLAIYMNSLDITLQFEYKNLPVRTIRRYDHINKIKISTSNNDSSWPYHSHDWLKTVPEMNKVTINLQFTMMDLPSSVMQPNCVHQTALFCLTLTLFCDKYALLLIFTEHTRSRTQVWY